MPTDQQPESSAVDAGGLTALLAAMTIEIVAALCAPTESPEELLTDIANGLMKHADGLKRPADAALVRGLARDLIATEDSGL